MEIINHCKKAPWGLVGHVKRSLKWIDPAHLEDISCIWLIDELPKLTDKSPESLHEAKKEGWSVRGLYKPRSKKYSAYITLIVKDIYRGVPRHYWLSPMPTLLISRTLAHEVAHHLVAKRGYIFKRGEKYKHREYEETAANRYAFEVLRKMQKRWYYRFGRKLIKFLADTHYIVGIHEWKDGNYKKAAERWHIAQSLNPDHDEATYWYWRAKKMCISEQEEKLAEASREPICHSQ